MPVDQPVEPHADTPVAVEEPLEQPMGSPIKGFEETAMGGNCKGPYMAGELCAGEEGKGEVEHCGCVNVDGVKYYCTGSPGAEGYGNTCAPVVEGKEYHVGDRCMGEPGKMYVPYYPCVTGSACDEPDLEYGMKCSAATETKSPGDDMEPDESAKTELGTGEDLSKSLTQELRKSKSKPRKRKRTRNLRRKQNGRVRKVPPLKRGPEGSAVESGEIAAVGDEPSLEKEDEALGAAVAIPLIPEISVRSSHLGF